MKSKRSFEPHLVVKEGVILPGSEWAPQGPGWSFLHFTRGVGYWLNPRGNQELSTGSVLLLSERAQGIIRASQVSDLVVHFFRLQPERLIGLMTLGEQQFLSSASALEQFSVRVFRPDQPVAGKFRKVCEGPTGTDFRARVQLLDLFIEAFGAELQIQNGVADSATDAKARLTNMLNQTPASELLDLSFGDLVQEMRCTPRHLSRIFHDVVGMSFREKQAQVRLVRAQ